MPTIQVLTPPTAGQEPLPLALVIAQLRLDLDAASTDPAVQAEFGLLRLYASAARERVEAYTGRYLAPQVLRITYELGERYELPPGATATAVEGYFTTLEALANRASTLSEYRKSISISRELPWAEALQQTYTVTAALPASLVVPGLARTAMLELVAEMYQNREPTADLSVSWRVKLASLVVNPLGY